MYVDLSGVGNRLIVSANYSPTPSSTISGTVDLYQWRNNQWQKINSAIAQTRNATPQFFLGLPVALDRTGQRFVFTEGIQYFTHSYPPSFVNHIYEICTITDTLHQTVCHQYTWLDSMTYTQDTTVAFLQYTNDSLACDSLFVLQLKVLQPIAPPLQQIACQSYNWRGTLYTQSGMYADTLLASNGCDSILQLQLIIEQPYRDTLRTASCLPYLWQGSIIHTSGYYNHTLPHQSTGCDTLLTLDFTRLPIPADTTTLTVRQPPVWNGYTWRGTTYFQSGWYGDTIVRPGSCDSLLWLDLTVRSFLYDTTQQTHRGLSMGIPSGGNLQPSYSPIELSTQQSNQVPIVQVYPNPFQESFTVDLGALYANVQLELYAADGRRVFTQQYNQLQHTQLSPHPIPGIYLLVIRIKDFPTIYKKIIQHE